jgi:hypothetical protein
VSGGKIKELTGEANNIGSLSREAGDFSYIPSNASVNFAVLSVLEKN